MTENMIRLRLRSLQDSTMETRLGNKPPSVKWWGWFKRTQEAIRRGVPDASLEKEPSDT